MLPIIVAVLDRPRRCLSKGGTSTAIRQSTFIDCCTRVSPKHRALAYRSHRPCCSTPSAPIGCPTRSSQIAIEPAAPPPISLPAISSFGGFRTPALAAAFAAPSVIGRHPKTFTNCDIEDAGAYKQKAARRRPFNSILLIVDQTAIN